MKNKFEIFAIFILIGQSYFISGCQCLNQRNNSWIYDLTLDDFFMDFECLKVEKIIICTPDDNDPDEWTTLFEISEPEKISMALEALKTSRRGFMPAWLEKMKIITKHKKFIMDFDWDTETAYGTHWESKQFRNLLREWGFSRPK